MVLLYAICSLCRHCEPRPYLSSKLPRNDEINHWYAPLAEGTPHKPHLSTRFALLSSFEKKDNDFPHSDYLYGRGLCELQKNKKYLQCIGYGTI